MVDPQTGTGPVWTQPREKSTGPGCRTTRNGERCEESGPDHGSSALAARFAGGTHQVICDPVDDSYGAFPPVTAGAVPISELR
jgi:hypothetical protein